VRLASFDFAAFARVLFDPYTLSPDPVSFQNNPWIRPGLDDDVARILPIAFAFGISILFLAYSIGHMTGGHMNPAVSLMMALKRQMSFKKMLCYWVSQFVGALLASSLLWGSVSGAQGANAALGETVSRPPLLLGATTLDPVISTGNGFLLEFMGSFIFYFVISQTALDRRGIATTPFPALPIGLSLVVVHVGLIPFTGCGVNPARTFGPSMVSCMAGRCSEVVGPWYWIYWIGPFLASFAVAEVTAWMECEVDGDNKGDGSSAAGDEAVQAEGPGKPVAASAGESVSLMRGDAPPEEA